MMSLATQGLSGVASSITLECHVQALQQGVIESLNLSPPIESVFREDW